MKPHGRDGHNSKVSVCAVPLEATFEVPLKATVPPDWITSRSVMHNMDECMPQPVIRLGPGGDYRTDYIPGEHPGELDSVELEVADLDIQLDMDLDTDLVTESVTQSRSGLAVEVGRYGGLVLGDAHGRAGGRGRAVGRGQSVDPAQSQAGEVVGIGGMLSDVAGHVASSLADGLARLVGILTTSDGMLERQQLALFRLRHLATTSAHALEHTAPKRTRHGTAHGTAASRTSARTVAQSAGPIGDRIDESGAGGTRGDGVARGGREADGRDGGRRGSGGDEGWHAADESQWAGSQSGINVARIGNTGIGGRRGPDQVNRFCNEEPVELGPEQSTNDAHATVGSEFVSQRGTWRRKHEHESDTQATEDSATHSRLAGAPGLFADDAGTGRRDRREQGDGLRARRSPHQKERARARAQQGTLFVDR